MRSSSGECYLDLSVIEGMPFCEATDRIACIMSFTYFVCKIHENMYY